MPAKVESAIEIAAQQRINSTSPAVRPGWLSLAIDRHARNVVRYHHRHLPPELKPRRSACFLLFETPSARTHTP